MWGHIRVENPDEETVLPRTNSGLALTRLDFNGNVAVLSDERGNQIEARAVSGLRRNNPRNRTGRDYSLPEYQSSVNRGPIPEEAMKLEETACNNRIYGVADWCIPPGSQLAAGAHSEFHYTHLQEPIPLDEANSSFTWM